MAAKLLKQFCLIQLISHQLTVEPGPKKRTKESQYIRPRGLKNTEAYAVRIRQFAKNEFFDVQSALD